MQFLIGGFFTKSFIGNALHAPSYIVQLRAHYGSLLLHLDLARQAQVIEDLSYHSMDVPMRLASTTRPIGLEGRRFSSMFDPGP